MDITLLGLTIGMADAMLGVGLVLVYMANRTLNLAHGEFGAFAVAMMLALTHNVDMNYWLALVCSLAAAALLGAVVEVSFIRRLARSPRLIVLIATIGFAQLIIVGRLIIPKPTTEGGERILASGGRFFPVPFDSPNIDLGRVVLHPEHVMILVAGPTVALALFGFLRYSTYGVALRAAAENAPRAQLLGIPVRTVSTVAWVVAALLAAVGAILLAPVIGYSPTEAVGLPILMRGLAAATIARFESVSVAFVAGLGTGVIDQWAFFLTGDTGVSDAILLVVILAALLARRARVRRTVASEESSWGVSLSVRPLPPEVTAHRRWVALMIWSTMAGGAAILAAPFLLAPSVNLFLGTVMLVAVVAISLTILTGWAGQMSIGQWAFAGAGGVFGAQLVTEAGWGFWFGLAGALVIGGVAAFVLGLPALRLQGMELAVVTLGFAVASTKWLYRQTWFKGTGFLDRPEYISNQNYYFLGLGALVVAIVAVRRLSRSRIRRGMVAARDNPSQAASFGLSVVRMKLRAFVVAGALAAGAGFLWASGVGIADSSVFQPVRSLTLVAAVVIGGVGSIAGAVIGAFYLLAIPHFGASISPYIGLLATGVGLLALVLFLPGGLVQVVFGLRDWLARTLTGIDPRPQLASSPVEVPAATPEPAGEAAP